MDRHKHISVFMHILSMNDAFNSACACARMPLCVCIYKERERERERDVLHLLHTNVICLYDMHYRERDTYAQHVYKHAHMQVVVTGPFINFLLHNHFITIFFKKKIWFRKQKTAQFFPFIICFIRETTHARCTCTYSCTSMTVPCL